MDKTIEPTKLTNLTPIKKEDYLLAYKQAFGNITHACKGCGISRQTYYAWFKEDEKFSAAIKDLEEELNDEMKAELFKLAKSGNIAAIIFWLRRKHPEFMDSNLASYQQRMEFGKQDMKVEFVTYRGGEG